MMKTLQNIEEEIPTEELNRIFIEATERARRENRALGLSNISVKEGELVEEKPVERLFIWVKKPYMEIL